jgi:hypothetical protein
MREEKPADPEGSAERFHSREVSCARSSGTSKLAPWREPLRFHVFEIVSMTLLQK